MNWGLVLQSIDTVALMAILLTIGGIYREHRIMWKWFEENYITPVHRKARGAGAD